jgi:hypothetical protein
MIRSSKPDVRNPVLALPEARELAELIQSLPPEVGVKVERLLGALSDKCRDTGNKCWDKHKPPMAAYWKAWAVNWRHIRLSLRVQPRAVLEN